MQLPLDDHHSGGRTPGILAGLDLNKYLGTLRNLVFSSAEDQKVTLVLGNQSCDLDSFICAFTLSYFYNIAPNSGKYHRHPVYVPVLNLPYVEGRDLWRLRPEFAVAIRGAFDGLTPQSELETSTATRAARHKRDIELTGSLITIHELANSKGTIPQLKQAFTPSEKVSKVLGFEKVDTILVDHNAPAIETINDEDVKARFNIVGCIDHHVEENYVPKNAHPRIIRLGIGSCMSLVTQHLRDTNLWTLKSKNDTLLGYQQVSRLALAPVLVDTWNLNAPGDRVSDIDRKAATFLEYQIGSDFDPEDLYQQLATAKREGLNLLRTQEIFGRDYKSYNQEGRNGEMLHIGIASTVQDLNWLAQHANGREYLSDGIVKYARHGEKLLELFGLLTRSGDRKEVCIISFGEQGDKAIDIFEKTAGELDLQKWKGDQRLSTAFNAKFGKTSWKVWYMGDTTKSRKQVAPLLRNALEDVAHAGE